ncbi:sensor domain-containing diguanylate cyclase [Clostridium magnum]|uniref:Cyclic di-GMP phosphodiesterase Gmr n=1 Tax=Clostridium magnum DSM 2767 TaxID=1121326 RepID=A0A162SPB8_9CLOT|nr:PAS domain S-box protein [Clostridium magnum]KZL91693.1 cyclic di-GMP phosphodiesterase Gmr [Clostridium magnum DSM 2767]SHH52760.1 PAS domain S-box-containing protein/diguanylate cyclase (GGDEF) domain-containing protein [Clostridium magnum DSM 2767]
MHYEINKDSLINFLREVYIEIDDQESITFISKNCSNLLGHTQVELVGKNIRDILSVIPEKYTTVANLKVSVITKNGTVIPVDLAGSPIVNDNNEVVGYRFSLIDISSYFKFDSHEKTINQMFERSKDIIYRSELIPTFKFTYLSPSIEEILGYSVEEHLINQMLPFQIAHPDDCDILIRKITNNIDFSKPLPVRYRHKDGYYVWLDDFCIPIYDDNSVLVALEGFSRDITDKKQLEEKLERLSYYDGLTGAYNKYYLEKEIHVLDTEKDLPVGIIFCDLDNLKLTNDVMGHEFGDRLIVNTINILKDTFTENSVIARTGGDEFIIIIKDTSLSKVKGLYNLLCSSVEQQNKYNKELKVGVSIGY